MQVEIHTYRSSSMHYFVYKGFIPRWECAIVCVLGCIWVRWSNFTRLNCFFVVMDFYWIYRCSHYNQIFYTKAVLLCYARPYTKRSKSRMYYQRLNKKFVNNKSAKLFWCHISNWEAKSITHLAIPTTTPIQFLFNNIFISVISF